MKVLGCCELLADCVVSLQTDEVLYPRMASWKSMTLGAQKTPN